MAQRIALLAALLLAGCTTASGDYCDIAKPIYMSNGTIDVMTDAETQAVLRHNLAGSALCRWQP